MKLSLVVPVYNEEETLEGIFDRIFAIDEVDQIIVVDDGSRDQSVEVIKNLVVPADKELILIEQNQNKGKGAALRAGFKKVTGDIVGIQDADMEYFPEDIPKLTTPIRSGITNVVYGSRNLSEHQSYSYFYYLGNSALTFLTNLIYNIYITDVETCYKFFKRELIENKKFHSNSFTIENELTAHFVKSGCRIYEVPIRYSARGREEGKKITSWDGIKALGAILYYRFF